MSVNSKRLLSVILALVIAACVFGLAVSAQQTEKAGKKAGSVSVTGCLQKGDEPNEYMLTGDDGKTYGLRSSSVKLSEHVGHKITVSGSLKAEGHGEKGEKDEDEARETKEGGNKEAGDIQVSKLKMVSESCSK